MKKFIRFSSDRLFLVGGGSVDVEEENTRAYLILDFCAIILYTRDLCVYAAALATTRYHIVCV